MTRPTFFRSGAELRAWLEVHGESEREILIGFYKKGAKQTGITYAEALDEALAFGWIDGVLTPMDSERYARRFTPRKKGSIWSKVNIAHVERLTAAGRMTPAGLAAFAARRAARTGIYSFEQEQPIGLDADRAAKLAANARASAFFADQPPSYQRTAAFWVMSAKRDETRDRRLAVLIECSARGELAPPFSFGRKPKKETSSDHPAPQKKAPQKKAQKKAQKKNAKKRARSSSPPTTRRARPLD